MKTAIDLIRHERNEQIEKHGFTIQHDATYKNNELFQAASFCLELANFPNNQEPKTMLFEWPKGWDKYFEMRIKSKSRFDQMIIAAAFFMADDDRLEYLGEAKRHSQQIFRIATRLDSLI